MSGELTFCVLGKTNTDTGSLPVRDIPTVVEGDVLEVFAASGGKPRTGVFRMYVRYGWGE